MSQQDKALANYCFYDFGPFRVDVRNRLLLRDGKQVPLSSKVFEILLIFLQNSGFLLSKEFIMRQVWANCFVEEGNLTRNVSTLRKCLGEKTNEPCYILTVPGHGYRFVAEVRRTPSEIPGLTLEEPSPPRIIVEERGDSEASNHLPEAESSNERWPATNQITRREATWQARRTLLGASLLLLIVMSTAIYLSLPGKMRPNKGNVVIKSIAVLPFKPLVAARSDPDIEMGIADTLINKLSNIRHITVRSISSVRKYTALDQDAVAAGRELGVDAVLEGAIHWEGEKKIRVTWRLLRVEDGATLIADRCDQECEIIFDVQDAIAERVTDVLKVEMNALERESIAKHHTENVAAYQLYLKGRYFFGRRSKEDIKKSVDNFRRAIAIDPSYELAYAGLADAYASLSNLGVSPPREAMPKSREAARKALELDGALGEAHASLAVTEIAYDWDWPVAGTEIRRAIELNPDYAYARLWYANYLQAMGRVDEAIEQTTKAHNLEPLSLLVARNHGRAYYYARQYDQAIAIFQEIVEMDPDFPVVHNWLSLAYEQKGMHDEAVAEDLKMRTIRGDPPEEIATLRTAYATRGWIAYWQNDLEISWEAGEPNNREAYALAQIYTRLGNRHSAFEWLQKAFDERSIMMVWLGVDPTLDGLHSDPRFKGLLRRMGIPS